MALKKKVKAKTLKLKGDNVVQAERLKLKTCYISVGNYLTGDNGNGLCAHPSTGLRMTPRTEVKAEGLKPRGYHPLVIARHEAIADFASSTYKVRNCCAIACNDNVKSLQPSTFNLQLSIYNPQL